MYQNLHFDRETNIAHIWDDEKGYFKHNYKPYGYKKVKHKTKLRSLAGDYVEKTYDLKSRNLFESDVNPETRILVDLYLDSDDVSKDIKYFFFDIEVEKGEDGYSTPEDASNRITSIAFYDSIRKKYVALILDEDGLITNRKLDNTIVISCANEIELLKKFYQYYQKISPHILVGWNSDYFDIPYLYNRTNNVLGTQYSNKLSPIGKVKLNERSGVINIAGVTSFDLMTLYRKFTFGEKLSYSLEHISQTELGRGKVSYEKDLDHFYKTDIEGFIQYNITDVELMVALDAKLDFLELARALCHKGHVPYDVIKYPSSYLDGASLVYLKQNNIVAPNKFKKLNIAVETPQKSGGTKLYVKHKINNRVPGSGSLKFHKSKSSHFTIHYKYFKDNYFVLEEGLPELIKPEYKITLNLPGAYVKQPIPGLYKWIFDLDLTSLYPSIIMTLNISPETKIGKILNWNSKQYLKNIEFTYLFKNLKGKTVELNLEQTKKLINDNNYSIAANGVLYRQDIKGFIPTILEKWFDERVVYKNSMKKYGKIGDSVNEKFWNSKQMVQKTLLNTFYGVLALQSFRFNDLDNASAITSTAQEIIKFSSQSGNQYFNRKLGTTDVNYIGKEKPKKEDYCIYIDTDSVAGDSILRTKYGEMQIDDFFNKINVTTNKHLIDMSNREFIFPEKETLPYYDEKDNKVKVGNIEYVEKHLVKKRMFLLKTKSGKSIKVTEDHSIMVLRNNKLQEIKPLEIIKGDLVIKIK